MPEEQTAPNPSELVQFRGLTVNVEKIPDGTTETGFPLYKAGRMFATVAFQVGEKSFVYELKDFNAEELAEAMVAANEVSGG